MFHIPFFMRNMHKKPAQFSKWQTTIKSILSPLCPWQGREEGKKETKTKKLLAISISILNNKVDKKNISQKGNFQGEKFQKKTRYIPFLSRRFLPFAHSNLLLYRVHLVICLQQRFALSWSSYRRNVEYKIYSNNSLVVTRVMKCLLFDWDRGNQKWKIIMESKALSLGKLKGQCSLKLSNNMFWFGFGVFFQICL